MEADCESNDLFRSPGQNDLAEPVGRQRLYEEAWSEPMLALAKRYGVSSSYLARVFEHLNIPRPPRGYWAKLAVGKQSDKPPLPEAGPGELIEWARSGHRARTSDALPKAPGRGAERPSVSSKHLSETHPLLVGAQSHFDHGRISSEGYVKPYKRLLVDIVATKEKLPAALAMANTLFQNLEARHHRVTLAQKKQNFQRHALDLRDKGARDKDTTAIWNPANPTIAYFGSVAIGLTIFELTEEVEFAIWLGGKEFRTSEIPKSMQGKTPWYRYKKNIPTGRLCIQAYSPYWDTEWLKQWRESDGEPTLEVASIVNSLERGATEVEDMVATANQRTQIRYEQWQVEQERWRREEEERRSAAAYENSRKDLFAIIAAWAEAKRIEEFLRGVEQRAGALEGDARDALLARLHRAHELIGNIDPLYRFLAWQSPEERFNQKA